MPDVRYMGKHHWTQVVLKDDGSFKEFNIVAPGESVSVSDDVATRLLQGPRDARLFVAAGSSEDPNSKDYVRSKWDADIDIPAGAGMYVSQDLASDYGSTTPDGRAIFVTDDENPHDLPVAPPEAGPQSDNARLYEEDEIQAEADKARAKAREARSSTKSTRSPGAPSGNPSSSPASGADR
jgi:hypothetical protein